MSDERKYVVNKMGHVGWIVGKHFHTPGYMTSDMEELRPATEEEIIAVEQEIVRRDDAREKRKKEEQAILDMVGVGLTSDDFCRFRNAYVEENCVVVCTRENGVGGFSSEAVKKAGAMMVGRENDDGDSTYAYYTFNKLGF